MESFVDKVKVTKITANRNLRKPRVAAYARVSSLMQEDSFETQREYFEKKIRSNPDWEFAGVYGEQVSWTHVEERKEFNQMVKDAMHGKIDLILCKRVSRWARNTVEGLKAIKLLAGNRVYVVFEQEGIDTRMPGIVLQLNLAASIAQSESESISENLKWTYRKRAEQGIFRPRKGIYFGFDTGDGQFKPDGNAEYVREIFRRYRDGEKASEIAKWLNSEGKRTARGNQFTAGNVKGILENEKYVGDVWFGKSPSRNIITGEPDKFQVNRYMKDHHEGIIDRETWDEVQCKLKSA